jgi:hypothetical protein
LINPRGEEFNKQLLKKQYVEVVEEDYQEDKLKSHSQIISEVFKKNEN